ncbi:hypothetical protein HYY72_05530 [Candidatus Woesearchaeota archaeon]|nr:hypothetical protein [Candidatus Woesearchaeota archaeon]
MGVEEIQKINNLAKELLKHHIASSSEDAYARAELMVKGEPQKENNDSEVNKELRMLGLKMNSLYSELVSLQHEVKGMKDEIAYIKNKLQSEAFQRPSAPIQQAAQHHEEPGEHAETQKVQDAPKKTEGRSRTGDYSEKDVEIEKFFYYGTNKK